MEIVVYTVILGGYDNLRPPKEIEPGVRYVCISDADLHCPPWIIVPAWSRYSDRSRNSRIPKILPHLFFDCGFSIYHDGCFVLNRKPTDIISEVLREHDLALYRHPCRKSVYEELEICQKYKIGFGPEMTDQVARYRAAGLGVGLWAGGLLIRRHSLAVEKFNEIWFTEYRDGCGRDQFALPMAMKKTGIPVNTIDGNILEEGRFISFCWHAGFDKGDNASFLDERKAREEKLRRLEKLCPI